jgi:hypothetical protein
MKGKLVGTVEFGNWHGVSTRMVWKWINEGMPVIRDETPRTPVKINTVEAD